MRKLIDIASERLERAGVDSPRLDAELLLAAAVGTTRPQLIAGTVVATNVAQIKEFSASVARRERREPVAYIIGGKGFRQVELAVDCRVLIPRPETELLVEVVKAPGPCEILDVGTGSGAIALALADELQDATVTAVDVSAAALALARKNAASLGLESRTKFLVSDLLSAVNGSFDAIAANLPYVATGELATLQPEIARHEPVLALNGGADGLDLVRRLVAAAPGHLNPGGLIALEVAPEQAGVTAELLGGAGLTGIEIHRDLSDRDRVVSAVKALA